ncbi:MAG: hypothetical protein A2855_02970 [Candidatus Liptonbacteria bacterium RIFCSPHIGHO2_01_FULL_57_28]|uniref:Fido domain-containing protein n=1 Tax=Candidatus Liptonbacteria bacterium RIFCSPHIGHO2_01_FULL_57_28 TaxID=1798647 RepID=A0A1G2C9C7_9BACT|nr:MAG: hypothetical protein A2855_02970 [Candidatus Liptonbacteria bacterium RIFCSPHIGHO2_01_FULL_57_28]
MPAPIDYLETDQVLLAHSMVIDETGGLHGIRDLGVLAGAVFAPRQQAFGQELYPGLFLKAAVYARGIMMNHAFLDGNKRTGMTAASVFLERNGYLLKVKEDEIANFAVRVVETKMDHSSIAIWLKKHCSKIKAK